MKKALGLLMLLALVACADDSDTDSATKEKPVETASKKEAEDKLKIADLICPQVAILVAAQKRFDYGGETPDPSQLVAVASMKKIEGDCAYLIADPAKGVVGGIDISYTLHMRATRGPRLGGDASFPFFVAVIDPSDNILSRQTLTARFHFGDDSSADDDEDLHVFIPLPDAALQSGPNYRVLAGFRKSSIERY